eukprot:364563-Chlamydomonas_euryale.AAC.3
MHVQHGRGRRDTKALLAYTCSHKGLIHSVAPSEKAPKPSQGCLIASNMQRQLRWHLPQRTHKHAHTLAPPCVAPCSSTTQSPQPRAPSPMHRQRRRTLEADGRRGPQTGQSPRARARRGLGRVPPAGTPTASAAGGKGSWRRRRGASRGAARCAGCTTHFLASTSRPPP